VSVGIGENEIKAFVTEVENNEDSRVVVNIPQIINKFAKTIYSKI
jgi:hypothetical protein